MNIQQAKDRLLKAELEVIAANKALEEAIDDECALIKEIKELPQKWEYGVSNIGNVIMTTVERPAYLNDFVDIDLPRLGYSITSVNVQRDTTTLVLSRTSWPIFF